MQKSHEGKAHLHLSGLIWSFLQNYLSSRGKSWKDLRQEALRNVEEGKYDPTGKPEAPRAAGLRLCSSASKGGDLASSNLSLPDRRISGRTVMCICCGLRALADLAYKYRQSIAPAELPGRARASPPPLACSALLFHLCSHLNLAPFPSPAAVTARPDCYWGRNCRTQVKAHHAT